MIAFANSDLSAFYLDMAKDRLYVSSKQDPRRRACQTVIHHLLEQLAVLMAPIVPHVRGRGKSLPYSTDAESVFEKGGQTKDLFLLNEGAIGTKCA